LIVAAAVAAILSAPMVRAQQFINVLTNDISGVYYPLGPAGQASFDRGFDQSRREGADNPR
jgi:TRAP-type uncharacterized transport system substrate-binding protein